MEQTMSFRISGLSQAPFQHLFGLSDEELKSHGAIRYRVDSEPGFPCRITLRDLPVGDNALLLNWQHQPNDTPYRASHAIFVREGGGETGEAVDTVPDVLHRRLLSLRAFDRQHMIVDADVVKGDAIGPRLESLLSNPAVDYIQAHFAGRGCFAARIDRV
jgi:hypothetical protein